MSKAEKTKQYIIEKTAPIFNKQGFAGTSMKNLEDATGLTKGAIYGNFEDKNEVAIAAFDYNMEKITTGIIRMMDGKKHAIERMKVYPAYYRKFLTKYSISEWYGCPIVNTAPEADDTHPKLREKVNAAIKMWHESMTRILIKGMDRGEVRLDANPSQFASQMIALIEGSILLSKSMNDARFFQDALDLADKMIENIAVS
jgi:TetR/AcrR family transcriptional regulator, transcriptional repressor for nem operon